MSLISCVNSVIEITDWQLYQANHSQIIADYYINLALYDSNAYEYVYN